MVCVQSLSSWRVEEGAGDPTAPGNPSIDLYLLSCKLSIANDTSKGRSPPGKAHHSVYSPPNIMVMTSYK